MRLFVYSVLTAALTSTFALAEPDGVYPANKNRKTNYSANVGTNGGKVKAKNGNTSVGVGKKGASVSVRPDGGPFKIGFGPNGPRFGYSPSKGKKHKGKKKKK